MSFTNSLESSHCESVAEYTFVWKISNFTHINLSRGQSMVSPSFRSQNLGLNNSISKGKCVFYPRGVCVITEARFLLERVLGYDGLTDCLFCVFNTKHQCLYRTGRELVYDRTRHSNEIATFDREIFQKLTDDAVVFHIHLGKKTSLKSENVVHELANTNVPLIRTTFHWEVKNFGSLQLREEQDYGPLVLNLNHCVSISLRLGLTGTDLQSSNVYIAFIFEWLKLQAYTSCVLFIMDENEKVLKHLEQSCWIGQLENVVKFILKREEIMARGFSTGSLVLKGKVKIFGDKEIIENVVYGMETREAVEIVDDSRGVFAETSADADPFSSLQANMLSLFRGEGPKGDFELRVGRRTFSVHQTILAARSTVFRALFDSNMKEATSRSLKLRDIDAATAERMLRYAYADQPPGADLDWESLANLYVAADKYALLGLRRICGNGLSGALDVDRAPLLLQLSDRHSDPILKQQVSEFIALEGPAILETENWKQLEVQDSKLVYGVLSQIMRNKWV